MTDDVPTRAQAADALWLAVERVAVLGWMLQSGKLQWDRGTTELQRLALELSEALAGWFVFVPASERIHVPAAAAGAARACLQCARPIAEYSSDAYLETVNFNSEVLFVTVKALEFTAPVHLPAPGVDWCDIDCFGAWLADAVRAGEELV